MNDLPDLEALRNTHRKYVGEVKDEPEWRVLTGSAIWCKHTGDVDGAIDEMRKAIDLTRTVPNLLEETAMSLNYLADLYLLKNADDRAEEVLRESIEFSRSRYPFLLAANLCILAGIQNRNGKYREALAAAEESLRVSQEQSHSYGIERAEEIIGTIKRNLE
jgi:Flp pilus assembly protein TadD